MTLIRKGSKGAKVLDVQRRIRLLGYELGPGEIDGIFGPKTETAIKKFQQDRSVSVTGIVDDECWQELVDAGYSIGERMLYLKEPPFRGDDVKILQLWLKTLGFFKNNESGIFDKNTHYALIEFQKNMKLNSDGIFGGDTFVHLNSLKRIINEKKSSNFPFIPDLKKKKGKKFKIILDFGDLPAEANKEKKEYGKDEVLVCSRIIDKCKNLLEKEKFEIFLTVDKTKKNIPGLYSRIKKANKSKGDLLISLNLNYCSDPKASGSSCYYFKGLKSFSVSGKKAAEMIQENLINKLKITDCRVHGTSNAILKDTIMTSVLVEPGFISNTLEAMNLLDDGYQDKISACIFKAVKDYFE
ncbi:MAG: N-acetylmuramoyl-L-alanine amidase [Candidatus Humimicrobiaceae bacterium]